jgi:phage gpG-like protein
VSITMGQLASRFAVAASKVNPVTERQLATIAQLGIGYVKEEIQGMHAVDTGTMLNSTQSEKIGHTYLIGPTVHYAPYVALGTSRMPARPFHIAAARRLRRDVKDFLKAGDLGL